MDNNYFFKHLNTSEWYDTFLADILNVALKHIDAADATDRLLLNLGCADGRTTQAFYFLGFKAIGIDIDNQGIRSAKAACNHPHYCCGDIHHLPLKSASLDVISSFSVLQYTEWDKVLSECQRVLKPDGMAFFVENLEFNPFSRFYRWLHRLLKWQYKAFQTPKQYMNEKNKLIFQKYFSTVSYQNFHLLTPLVLVFPALRDGFLKRPLKLQPKRIFHLLSSWDKKLLQWFPKLKKYYWLTLICVKK
jgi:SAM-dependent methyltransferase